MRKIILFVFCTLLISCVTTQNSRVNIYQKKGEDFLYVLKLKSIDSTFSFSQKYFEANTSCEGKWSKKSNIITLNCNDIKNFTEKLASGYMSKRKFTIKIIDKNNIKLDNVQLEKIKD